MNENNKLMKSAVIIVICTFLSKILGLVRDMSTASKFGAGSSLDAFFAASNVPMILFITIGAAITTTLIPLYNEKLKEGKKVAFDFINNVLNFFVLATIIISLLGMVFSKSIVSFLNPGFQGQQLQMTQILTIILIPTLIFNAVIYIFNGVLQSENNFAIPSLIALPFNILIIGYLLLYGSKYGVMGLTIVTFIATFIQIVPQIPYIIKNGFKYKLKINFKDPMLKKMGVMLIPVILGTGIQQINSFVERGVATNYSAGSLSALTYGYRVFALIVDIFVVTISTVVYPRMARQTAMNQIEEMKVTLSRAISVLVVFILPISLIVMVQSKAIIYILFERGAFNRSATILTSQILFYYSIGLLAFGLRDFICKAFYTLKDTRTPMINSAMALVTNVILIFVFQRYLGLRGLALANATSMYIACILLAYSLRKKIGSINGKLILNTTLKTGLSCVIMIISIRFLNTMLSINYSSLKNVLLNISISSICGIVIFIIFAYVLRIDEIKIIRNMIITKRRNK